MNLFNDIDERFQEAVWESKIPIRIEMALNDLMTSELPLTLYYSLPRMGYLSSLFGEIKKNYDKIISARLEDIWLDYNKIPLKWHIPFGVLVDSFNIDLTKGPIPITVHVSSFPTETVIKFPSFDTLRFYYINSLKEANIIKYPAENKVINLKLSSTNLLKEMVNENKTKMLQDYRRIMNEINGGGFSIVQKYPVRLLFSKSKLLLTKPITVNKDNANTFTMSNYFNQVLKEEAFKRVIDTCDIIIHGLPVEMKMPFLFYYLNFSYWDNFLYISFVEKENK